LRMNGRPRAAYLFAKEAAQIPYPQNDILFIDNNIYDWMALDELGSTAFYTHDYQLGAYACEKLLKEGRLPQGELERVRTNFNAYKERLTAIHASKQQAANPVPVVDLKPNSLLGSVLTTINTDKKRKG
jgi:hypothetical protein